MKKHVLPFLAACGIAALACPTARAVLPGADTFEYVTDQSVYYVAPSGTVVVSVYLRDTFTGSTSALETGNGLIGFDVKASRTSGSATITAMTANQGAFSLPLGAVYDPTSLGTGVSAAGFSVSALDSPGPTGVLAGNTRTLLLGTFSITMPAAGGTSTFQVLDWPGGTNTVLTNATALDSNILPATFTVATPEPATLAIFGAAAGATLLRRTRRSRRS